MSYSEHAADRCPRRPAPVGYGGGYGGAAVGGYGGGYAQPQTTKKAIWALVLGILGLSAAARRRASVADLWA